MACRSGTRWRTFTNLSIAWLIKWNRMLSYIIITNLNFIWVTYVYDVVVIIPRVETLSRNFCTPWRCYQATFLALSYHRNKHVHKALSRPKPSWVQKPKCSVLTGRILSCRVRHDIKDTMIVIQRYPVNDFNSSKEIQQINRDCWGFKRTRSAGLFPLVTSRWQQVECDQWYGTSVNSGLTL